MSVVDLPPSDQCLAEAVQTLNQAGPEVVMQAALKWIEEHQPEPLKPRPHLYLVVDNTGEAQ